MAEPIIRQNDREKLVKAGSTPIDVVEVRNLLGSLLFRDDDVPAGVTLAQLLAQGSGGESRVSGLRRNSGAQLSRLSDTQVRLSAPGVPGVLVERQADGAAIEHDVDWAQIDATVAGVDDPVSYWVIQDVGFTGTGTLLELSVPPSEAGLRTPYILLGASYHWGGEVRRVKNFPAIYNDQGHRLDGFIEATGSRVRKVSGRTSETPSTLSIEHTEIVLNGRGLNFGASFIDPDNLQIAASGAAVQFDTIKPNGEEFQVGQTTMPSAWNDGGAETVLAGTEAAVHQVAMGPDGQVFVQLGTTAYPDYGTAVDSMQAEADGNPLWSGVAQFGVRLGYVVISANAVVWTDGDSRFFELLQSGVISGAPAILKWTQLQDTPDTMVGKAGQVPKVNATQNALEFGKVRSSVQLAARDVNVDAGGGAVIDVAMPARVGAATFIIDNVHFELVQATSGDTLELDVFINGATIFGGPKPTIADGGTEVDAVPTVTTHVKGNKIRLDVLSGNDSWEYLTATLEGWIIPET